MAMMTSDGDYRALTNWLNRLRRRGKQLVMSAGGIWTAAVVATLLVIVPILEAIFRFSITGRWILVILSLGIAGILLLWGVVAPWMSLMFLHQSPRDEMLATKVGQRVPSIHDRLLNALQLRRIFRENPEGYSPDLAKEAIDEVTHELDRVELKQVESSAWVKKSLQILVGAVVAVVVAYVAGGGILSASLYRLSKPSTDFPRPLPFQLFVSPGDSKALKGDTVTVAVRAQGKMPAKVRLFSKPDSRKEADDFQLTAEADSVFRFALGPVRESLNYWVQSGPVEAGPYRLLVRERPFIRSLKVKVIPPAYSKLPVTINEENVGDVTALKGSKVELFAETNLELATGWLELEDGAVDTNRQDLEVLGNRLHGTLSIMNDFGYRIRMRDSEGIGDRDPIWYRISAIEDRQPTVRIVQPANDVEITGSMALPLLTEAEDDFGISKMLLRYHRAGLADGENFSLDDYQTQDLTYKTDEDGAVRCDWLWELGSMNLLPEDVVTFYVEVWDNDQVTGPKMARSEVRTIRFPSLADLYSEADKEQQDMGSDLTETLQAAKELSEAMEKITEEWKQNPEMTWEEQQRLQEVMKQQEQLAKSTEQIAQQMKELVQSVQENSLFTEETLQKYMELQELMERVATPELREAMRKLQEALQKQNPEELLKAMEEFQLTQADFEKQLDRSINILKQLELEMKMDELVKRVDELLKRQESVNEQTEQPNADQKSQELSTQEESLSKDMKSTENEFQKASDLAKELAGQTPQDMQDISDFMNSEQLPSEMQSMASSMSGQQCQKAGKKGRKISQKLNQLSQMMQKAKKSIVQKRMDQLMAALERETANLLRLSFAQEDIVNNVQGLDVSSPKFDQVAEKQQDVKAGLNRVADSVFAIGRETFFVGPQIGAALGEAMQKVDAGLGDCNNRDGQRLSQDGRQAMAGLNRAAMLLQQASDQMSSSCSSTGGEEMMKRLSQMSCQQEGLNQNTLSLFQGNQGQWTQQQMSSLRRMAGEQGQIQKSLEELAREANAAKNALGKLDEVGKQMGEVVNDMKDMNVDERTIRRQEQILTRLLDAQRSVREREYSPKRESRPGEDMVRKSPTMRNPHTEAEQLRQDLLKALEGHYVKDYERLIRLYFDALAREKVTGNSP